MPWRGGWNCTSSAATHDASQRLRSNCTRGDDQSRNPEPALGLQRGGGGMKKAFPPSWQRFRCRHVRSAGWRRTRWRSRARQCRLRPRSCHRARSGTESDATSGGRSFVCGRRRRERTLQVQEAQARQAEVGLQRWRTLLTTVSIRVHPVISSGHCQHRLILLFLHTHHLHDPKSVKDQPKQM